jgi:hypothetical protein
MRPLLAGISGDLGVKDGKAGLQFGKIRPDFGPVLDQQGAAPRSTRRAFSPQHGITHHVADRHAGGLERSQKGDPCQNGLIIFPVVGTGPGSPRQQPDPLVIADRMGAEAAEPGQIADLHVLGLPVVTHRLVQVGVRFKSSRPQQENAIDKLDI